MNMMSIEWPCGCKAEPGGVRLSFDGDAKEAWPVRWELHHCPLHSAASDLLAACEAGLTELNRYRRKGAYGDRDSVLYNIIEQITAAVFKAEPKRKDAEHDSALVSKENH